MSFAEKDLPPGQREKLMASFERVLMPGLDKDQYSVLWVEHQDKGRLELNFLIPNTELLTGKRLQPYYDRADRPRIDAWQTIVNGRLGLHDPNAPENRRALVTPSALPETKQEAAQAITRGLLALASSGELKTRPRTSLRRWKAQVLRWYAPQKAASALPTRTGGETSD
ncbi:relaxase/mobilization nuclease domain-containing protein [Enterobacter hormaechei]|uniref:relaxase/mobilization nuclease domain-containing protein n=1 Tax=Enterobacter hormaechei TaxID=158836 RepID=UPI001F10E9EF|nr:relaxase/mobilization nuclease domain-containing protein [Enterobacter hormaechei]